MLDQPPGMDEREGALRFRTLFIYYPFDCLLQKKDDKTQSNEDIITPGRFAGV